MEQNGGNILVMLLVDEKNPLDRLFRYFHKQPSLYFSFADKFKYKNSSDKYKLLIILRYFPLCHSVLQDQNSNNKISQILALYCYLIENSNNSMRYDFGIVEEGEFPISNIEIPNDIFQRISLAKDYLIRFLDEVDENKIYHIMLETTESVCSKYKDFETRILDCINHAESLKSELDERQAKWRMSSFSKLFSDIAREEKNAKRWWLGISLLFGSLGLALLIYNVIYIFFDIASVSIKEIILRVSSTFFLFLVAIWCGRIYNVARGQEIIYRHISASLTVYDMFKESIGDGNERNILVTQMCHTIFSKPNLPNTKMVKDVDFSRMVELLGVVTNHFQKKG